MNDFKKLGVIVLCGGLSEEREVSLDSGRAVYAGLKRLGHQALALDFANLSVLSDDTHEFPANISAPDSVSEDRAADRLDAYGFSENDVVFITLHGGAGEDGRVQSALRKAGVRYTGSDPGASALAIDKPESKRRARALGVPTADWFEFNTDQDTQEQVSERINAEFGYPLIIKPARGGSTVGLTLLKQAGEISAAFEALREVSPQGMAERYLSGREMTVTVFDDQLWPVVEVAPKAELYDYKSKYTAGQTDYFCPADIPGETAKKTQESASAIYTDLACRGLARVDFILDDSGQSWFLELNSIPGMTGVSLAPLSAKAAGISFDKLLQMMVDSALGN